jgi:F420-dependent methylenetetrahydromethanopterin dehydrogenase
MNLEDIIRMARETGFDVNFDIRAVSVEGVFINKELERFAALVAAAEREACAKICDDEATIEGVAQRCADAIRARSNV